MKLWLEQCRAARSLLNWSQEHLASLSGVSRSTIKDFECRDTLHHRTEELLIKAFEDGGVRLLAPDGEGPGSRLKVPWMF